MTLRRAGGSGDSFPGDAADDFLRCAVPAHDPCSRQKRKEGDVWLARSEWLGQAKRWRCSGLSGLGAIRRTERLGRQVRKFMPRAGLTKIPARGLLARKPRPISWS